MPRTFTVMVLLAAALLLQPRLFSQATNGAIQGTVTDSSGASVSGAEVQIKNAGTGVIRTLKTNDQGRYNATDLLVGEYEAQVTLEGFQTTVQHSIPVTVGSQRVVDFTLQVGRSQQTVTIEAAVSQVDTTSSAVSTLVEQKQIAELPLNGRNYTQLIALAPGVQQTTQAGTGTGFYGRQASFSVAGSRPEGQAFLLDNVDVQGFWNRGVGSAVLGTTLGVEALAEFSAQTNTYSAQFGGNGGAINAVTRSGTNQFHGSLFEFLRNSAMDARSPFDGNSIPPFKQNQFGGAVGGPIVKEKAFFFFNYEGVRRRRALTNIATVPDANARLGLLPGSTPINLSPLTKTLLSYYPLPTIPLSGGLGQVPIVATQSAGENYILGRVDYNLRASDSLFGRYVSDRADFTDPFSGSFVPLWPETHRTKNQYMTVEERHVFSPAMVNLVRASLVRTSEGSDLNQNLPGLYFYPNRKNGNIGITGITGLGSSIFLPFKFVQNKYSVDDDIYWTHGSHNVKLGGIVQRTQSNVDAPGWLGGQYSFASLAGFLNATPTAFLGPLPGQTNGYRDFRDFNLIGYVTDDWKVSQRLTVNIGLRYHFITNPTTAKQPLNAILNFAKSTTYEKVSSVFKSNPAARNFDPRIGFAYDLFGDHKTSIRGGFGIFHNVIVARTYASGYYFNPPYALGTAANPVFPDPFAGGVLAPQQTQANGVNYDTKSTPYQMQFNLNIQREVMDGTIVSVGYVGSRGVHLFYQRDQNPVIPQLNAQGQQIFSLNGVALPRANPSFSEVNSAETAGNSTYHSLQASLNRRYKRNLQYGISYTWSHSIDNSSSTSGLEGGNPIMNTYDAGRDRANSIFDRRHTFATSSVMTLPFRGRFVGHQIIEGWQLSGILSARSGAPFNVNVGFDNTGALPAYQGVARPNLNAGRTVDDIYTGQVGARAFYFDKTAFSTPAAGVFGNFGRNVLVGPKFVNLDMSAIKDTKLKESLSLQFRAEFFNLLNHPSWGNPTSAAITAASGGQILTTFSTARQIQLALKLLF